MNAVGIDVSKGKSTVAVMKPFGEIVYSPFEVQHTKEELQGLVEKLKKLKGESRIVIEYTGNYYTSIANYLCKEGFYVSVINAILVHDYKNNSLRRVKTDKKDAVKLANYGLDSWLELPKYYIEEDARTLLKNYYHQYEQYNKLCTMLNNNLISLLELTYPGVNNMFASHAKSTGEEKWVDYVERFYHKNCVAGNSLSAFRSKYKAWCKKYGYRYSDCKAADLHEHAKNCISSLECDEYVKTMICSSAKELQGMNKTLAVIRNEMYNIASTLPEFPIVMGMYGVGPALGPQLIAEIGDVRRFHSKKALVAYAGIDSQPYQSGNINVKSCRISKRGSSSLRHTLFVIMTIYIKNMPSDEPIYQFMMKKKAEGKPYKVYVMAAANKFLRQYYAIVRNYLNQISEE